jgi:hypothetical protein
MERYLQNKAYTYICQPPNPASMNHYKVKLIKNISHREAWVTLLAPDMQHARIAATLKCTKTEFIPDYTSLQEIDEAEYELLAQELFVK